MEITDEVENLIKIRIRIFRNLLGTEIDKEKNDCLDLLVRNIENEKTLVLKLINKYNNIKTFDKLQTLKQEKEFQKTFEELYQDITFIFKNKEIIEEIYNLKIINITQLKNRNLSKKEIIDEVKRNLRELQNKLFENKIRNIQTNLIFLYKKSRDVKTRLITTSIFVVIYNILIYICRVQDHNPESQLSFETGFLIFIITITTTILFEKDDAEKLKVLNSLKKILS